ncbi:hypothetical protein H072_9159 [Dactylellina haptotyla CBS 200.50]|uniref:Uncharacterized protein n=1 Tax=Dactylellina haptotyla (strain CBS 200.50) TaxID=1284197 RepID=S8BD95_DACHA|nr:hypothetical protein H072_9159 [Dactylellina haptotyla CBS 200.50]
MPFPSPQNFSNPNIQSSKISVSESTEKIRTSDEKLNVTPSYPTICITDGYFEISEIKTSSYTRNHYQTAGQPFENTIFEVFVSKYNGGEDTWFTLQPGGSDLWNRKEGAGGGWEIVAFRDGFDTTRVGRYVKVNTSIIFRSFEEVVVI